MGIDEIIQAKENRPFQPFEIITSAGQQLVVKHEDFIMLTPNRGRVIVFFDDDSFRVIDPLHVTEIHFPARRG